MVHYSIMFIVVWYDIIWYHKLQTLGSYILVCKPMTQGDSGNTGLYGLAFPRPCASRQQARWLRAPSVQGSHAEYQSLCCASVSSFQHDSMTRLRTCQVSHLRILSCLPILWSCLARESTSKHCCLLLPLNVHSYLRRHSCTHQTLSNTPAHVAKTCFYL